MRILVLFGTTEGQTRKIAQFIAERLNALGHSTTLAEAAGEGPDLMLSQYEAVVVAASLHQGQYQPAVVRLVQRHSGMLNVLPSVFVSVSLSAAGHDPDDVRGLQNCVSALEDETGWRPRRVHHVAGAFKFTQYNFLKRWALKYIAYRRGQPTDTKQDYELTDWNDLTAFIDTVSSDLTQPGKA